ncbi:MAG: radical SAM protein [Candidatus Omnitrophica bacterium]|nr:radical SAM protein [Candidatus Omnitrophota bacterium]MDD5042464.1 radical SAM protein [Candidatus Omnitrophota bacterium]MDD5501135.1 radical SAM protein [Candidatus Omnitrophota bacterium]
MFIASYLLNFMDRAGCSTVCIGFESINPMTLKAYKKNQTIDDIVRAIRSIRKNKIEIYGMFVLGGEDDSKETIWETLKFAIKQKIDAIQMMVLTPFPGTKVYDDLIAQKRFLIPTGTFMTAST